jgi:eukaryotic-like serine/threonine-protein kinase
LESLLGSGANGSVYAGVHLRLDQRVAIKLVPKDSASERALVRFEREGKAAARLANEHVARVLDRGEDARFCYLVQEIVSGETLAARVERDGPLVPDAVLKIGVALADGLQAIHAAGVVHRDLKPENVVLCDGAVAKIVDFGIVGEVATEDERRLTAAGSLLGTPRYVPPEQISVGAVTDKSDLYALGALLHVALTGVAPHEDKDTRCDNMALLVRRMNEPAADVRELSPDVPPGLAELLGRLLEQDPESRPSATDTLTALLALRREARAANEPAVADRSLAIGRWVAGGLALVVVALGGVLVTQTKV